MLMRDSSSQWREALYELTEKMANFDTRITRFKRSLAKAKRREQRIITKLAAFVKWLDLVEEDICRAETWHDEEEQMERLVFLANEILESSLI